MPRCESIYYETSGDKNNPAIIWLHGFLGSGRSWNDITAYLANNFYSVTVDLPGHGRSLTDQDSFYRFDNCAGTIIKIADELNLSKFNLAGYSMGGRLALFTALKYPNRIYKLVLESSSPGLKTEPERHSRREHDNNLADELEQVELSDFLKKWYEQPLFNSLKRDKIKLESLQKEILNNDKTGLARSLRLMGTGVQQSLWEKLPELIPPTLLIVGQLDTKFQGIAKEMSALSKKINVTTVTDTGHNVHFENPNEFSSIVKNFLK